MKSSKYGFMQIVLVAIVAIATLAYFNVDMRSIVMSDPIQKVWHILVTAWTDYIVPLFKYLWASVSGLFPAK